MVNYDESSVLAGLCGPKPDLWELGAIYPQDGMGWRMLLGLRNLQMRANNTNLCLKRGDGSGNRCKLSIKFEASFCTMGGKGGIQILLCFLMEATLPH